ERERERVEMRRHVAGAPRIAVVPPGAAHAVAALDHDDVVEASVGEADRHAQAARPGAEDDDAQRSLLVGSACWRRTVRHGWIIVEHTSAGHPTDAMHAPVDDVEAS